jgi:hypothetical protein
MWPASVSTTFVLQPLIVWQKKSSLSITGKVIQPRNAEMP